MTLQVFLVTALDHRDSAKKRDRLRPDHLSWLEGLADQLMLAGPLRQSADGPVIGSHLILKADNETAIRGQLAQDPYAKGGLFASVTIKYFQPVTGAWTKA